MGKDKSDAKKESKEEPVAITAEGYGPYGTDPRPDDFKAGSADKGGMVKIRLNAAVNGYRRGDEFSVDADHPFFSGLVDQGMAEVIG